MEWESLLVAAVGCYFAYGVAQFGADQEPVTWPLFTAVSIGTVFAFTFVAYSGLTGHNALIALAAFVGALIAGAARGNVKKQRRATEGTPRIHES